MEVASIPANASFASTTFIVCGASIQQSASVSQFVPWTFVEGLQQAKNARSARCDECLSAGVHEFSSPAVKPGHGFMISSLTLEFEYLVGGCPQDGNVSLGIGIGGIVVHSRILFDNPSGYAYWGHDFNFGFGALNATGLAVEAPIASTITLHVQGSRSISLKVCSALHFVWSYLGFHANPSQRSVVEHLPNSVPMTLWCTAHSDAGPSTSTFGTQVMTGVPVTTTYAMTFAPGKSVADFQVDSVREAFCLAVNALSRHLKQEEVTNMKKIMEWSL